MDLAILIDCFAFEEENSNLREATINLLLDCDISLINKFLDGNFLYMTKEIKRLVENTAKIETVILSSYHCVKDEYYSDSLWYKNSRKFLGDEIFLKKTKELADHRENFRTSEYFLNWKTDKNQIAMHNLWELEQFLLTNKVENIYFCGTAWDGCVAVRPIGYLKVYELISRLGLEINLLVHRRCVIDFKNNFFIPDDNPEWIQTSDKDIFKYAPNK